MHLTSPVLVGRHQELTALRTAVDRARKGTGGAVFVAGEPGIGKSRLSSEIVTEAAAHGCRVLRGRAVAGAPLRALAEAVVSALDTAEEDQLGAYRPVLRRLTPDAPTGLPDLDVVRAEALLQLLSARGTHDATVLVLEDLHDADAETLTALHHLMDGLADQPVLLLATLRPHAGPALELAESAAARGVAEVVRLRALRSDDTAELIARCLEIPAAEVPDDVVTHLHRDAGGMPFVVEELLGSMVESAVLRPDRAIWRVHGDVRDQLPPSVAAAILRRVDRLAARGVALLEAAAVLGHHFPLPVAAAVAGLAPDDAAEQLRAAAEARLVGDGPSFRHALTADAILGRLTDGRREVLSRSAAQAVETLRPQEEELAANLWAAGGATERAARLLVQAGQRAAGRGRLTSAVELLERGLSLLGPGTDPALEADLLETLTGVLVHTGNADRAITLAARLHEALGALEAPADRIAAVHVTCARAAALMTQWERGLDEIAAARRLLQVGSPGAVDAVEATLLLGLGQADRLAEARALAERAAGAENPEVVCEALDVLTQSTRGHDLARSRGYIQRWLEIAEQHGLVAWRLRALLELGITERYLTTTPDALLAARKAAFEAGAVVIIIAIDLHLAHTHILRGEYEEAARRGDMAAAVAGRLRLGELVRISAAVEAGIAAAHGSRSVMDAALARLRADGGSAYGDGEEIWAYLSGMCALMEERPEAALADFAEAERATSDVPIIRGPYFSFHGPFLLLRVVRGEAGWPEYERLAGSHLAQVHVHRSYLLWSRAVLLGRDGDTAGAAEAAAEAVALGLPRHLAARLVAPCALADGWGDPAKWLREAENHFRRRGTDRVAQACASLA